MQSIVNHMQWRPLDINGAILSLFCFELDRQSAAVRILSALLEHPGSFPWRESIAECVDAITVADQRYDALHTWALCELPDEVLLHYVLEACLVALLH